MFNKLIKTFYQNLIEFDKEMSEKLGTVLLVGSSCTVCV